MLKLIHKILDDYKEDMKGVVESNLNDFNNVEQGISVSRQYLQKLRICVRQNEFSNQQDEITFFKEHKPYIYSRLKFYAKLYNFLINRPAGTIKSQQEFIDAEIKKLQESNRRNIDFIKYYREQSTVLDEFYFLRGKDKISLVSNTSHFYTDAEFSTSHDNAVAKIMAYDLLVNHYVQELSYLRDISYGKSRELNTLANGDRLSWTASKTDLIELIYALQASGAIKSGKSEFAEKKALNYKELTYIALSKPLPNDKHWQDKIKLHKSRRPLNWNVFESDDLFYVLKNFENSKFFLRW